jgi:hypothetical protein
MGFGDILGGLAPLAGSAFGPVGAAAGGLAGNAIQDYFTPEDPNKKQLAQLMQQMGVSYQMKPLSFDDIAQGEQRRFNQQVLPGMAERFTGSGGGQRSSAYKQAIGGAHNDLISRLAELRSGFEERQQQAGLGAYNANQNRMSNLAGLLQGQSQQQQAGRESQRNRYAQLAGMLPKTMLENRQQQDDFIGNRIKNMMLAGQQGQRGQQGQQDFASRIAQLLSGQNTDTISGNVPSALQNAGSAYMTTQGQVIDALSKIIPALL